jgi:hypothetical protein
LKLPTPAVAVIPGLASTPRTPPSTQRCAPLALVSIRGTRSRMLAGARLVHKSGVSVTCVSASIIVYPLTPYLLVLAAFVYITRIGEVIGNT